jgi:hypothetical protein
MEGEHNGVNELEAAASKRDTTKDFLLLRLKIKFFEFKESLL